MGNVLKRESGSIPSVAKDCRGWGLITRPVRHTIMASPARTFVPFVTFCRFFDPCFIRGQNPVHPQNPLCSRAFAVKFLMNFLHPWAIAVGVAAIAVR